MLFIYVVLVGLGAIFYVLFRVVVTAVAVVCLLVMFVYRTIQDRRSRIR